MPWNGLYGGNKVKDCEENFLLSVLGKSGIPIIKSRSQEMQEPTFESEEDYLDVDDLPSDIEL
jgi:hypothetical protein